MADYKSLYIRLFNKITDAIAILQTAQAETENLYIQQEDPEIVLLENSIEDE